MTFKGFLSIVSVSSQRGKGGERGGEVYKEQFVAGWQSAPLRFTFPRGAQRAVSQ